MSDDLPGFAPLEQRLAGMSPTVRHDTRMLWKYGVLRVQDAALRAALEDFFTNMVAPQFYTTPSSRTGKYHLSWHNKEGGLLRNTVECCKVVPFMMTAYPEFTDNSNPKFPKVLPEHQDAVLAATMVSDSMKCGHPWGDTMIREHGIIAATNFLPVCEKYGVNGVLAKRVYDATYGHLGRWTPGFTAETKFGPHTQLTHLIDMFFTCKDLETLYTPKEPME